MLFLVVLVSGHVSLVRGRSTRIVGATKFLHREYKQARPSEPDSRGTPLTSL